MASKNATSLIHQASEKLSARQPEAALPLYREALAAQPGNAAALLGLAMALNQLGQYLEALPTLEKLLSAVEAGRLPLDTQAKASLHAHAGLALQHAGEIARALACFRLAHSLAPNNEIAAAIQHLEQATIPRSPIDQLADAARQAHRQGQLQPAAEAWKKVLQINPDHTDALFGLGMVLREAGQPAEALPLVQQAIILQPESAEYYNGLGMIFQDRGEFQKAITFHKRALVLNPSFAGASCNIGVAHKRLSQNEEAITAYRTALTINPNLAEAHNNIGNLLRILGRIDEARIELQKAIALRPGYRDALENLAALAPHGNTSTPNHDEAQASTAATTEPAPKTAAKAVNATDKAKKPATRTRKTAAPEPQAKPLPARKAATRSRKAAE